ncbi:MAG: ribose 5-phosphate isomerase B [Ignavibacteriales bacterium]|nr:ribose 5-phosphate isomerase B [Ignavibacteriales bacterium]
MIVEASKRRENKIIVEDDSIITDAARDRASQLGIVIEKKKIAVTINTAQQVQSKSTLGAKETIAIGSDHGGFGLKEQLRPYLTSLGYNIVDLGTNNEEPCDYPDFAFAVGTMVAKGTASRGIMIDTLGVASAMTANKIPGIRAACCFDEFSARSSREHNNANILTLGGKTLGVELAKSITKVWLETVYSGGRHQKRLDKLAEIEKRFLKTS